MRRLIPMALLLAVTQAGAHPRTITLRKVYSPEKSMRVHASGYCAGPCRICGTRGFTRTDKDARILDGVSTDWRVIPRGSKVYVPGYGWKVVDDTGGSIKGRRIDIRMSHAAAQRYGMKWITVKVRIARSVRK